MHTFRTQADCRGPRFSSRWSLDRRQPRPDQVRTPRFPQCLSLSQLQTTELTEWTYESLHHVLLIVHSLGLTFQKHALLLFLATFETAGY